MFGRWVKGPYERTRRLIEKTGRSTEATPLRSRSVGHRFGRLRAAQSDYGAFDLSADRANAVRQFFERKDCRPRTSSR